MSFIKEMIRRRKKDFILFWQKNREMSCILISRFLFFDKNQYRFPAWQFINKTAHPPAILLPFYPLRSRKHACLQAEKKYVSYVSVFAFVESEKLTKSVPFLFTI